MSFYSYVYEGALEFKFIIRRFRESSLLAYSALAASVKLIQPVREICISEYVQGSSNRRAPGSVNAAGKLSQK